MISIVGYLFSVLALAACIYTLFSDAAEVKTQAFYWFLGSLVSALIPHIKQLRYKDLEVSFKEMEARLTKKVEHLHDEFFVALEQVRAGEEALSPEYKKRRKEVFQRFTNSLEQMPAEERFREQMLRTRRYLNQFKLEVFQLKEMLKKLDSYSGPIDNDFTPELVDAITHFQENHGLQPADGIFGSLTYQKMAGLLGL